MNGDGHVLIDLGFEKKGFPLPSDFSKIVL
jgi:hypothetical protein